jgi:hypothetical protein
MVEQRKSEIITSIMNKQNELKITVKVLGTMAAELDIVDEDLHVTEG